MAITKRFLNRLWDVRSPMGDEFDPDHDFAYADRTRRLRQAAIRNTGAVTAHGFGARTTHGSIRHFRESTSPY